MDELRCPDIKEICNKLKEKYNISKDDWTISYDYDVLYNYMGFRLKFLSNCGHIRYDKESTDPTTGGKKPNDNAQYGAFNTGLKVDEKYIWATYVFENDTWNFNDVYIQGKDERDGEKNILDKIPTGKEDDEFTEMKNHMDELIKEWCNDIKRVLIVRIDHLLSATGGKNRSIYISKRLRSCFYNFMDGNKLRYDKIQDQKTLIEQLITYQLNKLNMQSIGDILKFVHFHWECPSERTKKDENDYEPLSLLFPIYILAKPQRDIPDLIVPITIQKKRDRGIVMQVETIITMKEAYMDAKLVEPEFCSLWLTIDNVKKSLDLTYV